MDLQVKLGRDGIYLIEEPFDFDAMPVDPIDLSNSMQKLTHEKDYVAIAAPQVDLPYRVIYIRGLQSAMFNPRIVDISSTQSVEDEMSASFPGLSVKIKRPDVIKVRFADALGEIKTEIYSGMTSRTIQRKIDLLNGIVFYSRANRYHRDMGFKRWTKINECKK